MFPDVNGQQRLHPFVNGRSALLVLVTCSLSPSFTSHAQPLPNCVVAAVASSFLHASTLPNDASIFCFSAAEGSPPPLGERLFQ